MYLKKLLLVLFINISFFACDEKEDLNKSNDQIPTPEIDNMINEDNSEVTTDAEINILPVTEKCVAFEGQINPISESDLNNQLANDNTALSDQILILLNEYRKSKELPELSVNNTAKYIALIHNNKQILENKISHEGFEIRSCSLFELENATKTGENVAFGYETAKEVVDAWLNSESHRKNIEGDFSFVGIGSTINKDQIPYYTNLFFKK